VNVRTTRDVKSTGGGPVEFLVDYGEDYLSSIAVPIANCHARVSGRTRTWSQPGKTVEGRTQVAVLPRSVRAIKPIGCGRAGQVPRGKILHRHEHACSTSSLGGSLFSDRTYPITGEPIPRSSTLGTSTRRVLEVAPLVGGTPDGCGGPSRQVLEVASFVPGPIRNRGSHTNRGLGRLLVRNGTMATPLHSNRMDQHEQAQQGKEQFLAS
jgi:hypothetical protein